MILSAVSRERMYSRRERACLSTEPLHLPADGHDPPMAASFWLSGHREHQGRLELKNLIGSLPGLGLHIA